MTGKTGSAGDFRQQTATGDCLPDLSTPDTRNLIHELRSHQIELEMQNEALRQAERALTDARDQMTDLFDFAPVGYASISDKGIIRQVNLRLADMLGLDRRALIQQRFSSFVAPQDCDQWYRHIVQLLRQHSRGACEISLMRRDGSMLFTRMDCLRTYDDGQVTVRIAITDISERHRAEQELIQQEAQYRRLFENMVDIYYNTDMSGHIAFVSPSCLPQTGYTQEELLGRPMSAFYADPVQRKQLLDLLQQQGQVNDFEVRLVHKDGSPRTASVSSYLLFDADKQAIGVEGIVRNITARKQAEEALRLSEERLNLAQRLAHIGHWELDMATGRLQWSDEVFRLFEVDPEQFAASYEAFLAMVHPQERELLDSTYKHSLQTRRPYSIEHRLLFADGRIKWVHEQCESTFAPDGTPLSSIGTVQDITVEKQAEQARDLLLQQNRALMRQLMQVQEEERRLLARDLHDELGQLLTSIDARAEYIVKHAEDRRLRSIAEEIVRDTRASFDASHATLLRLRPATLDALGLAAALTELTGQWNKQGIIDCPLRIDGEIDRLGEMHAITIYRLVQEALTNAFRHGKAKRVEVVVRIVPAHAARAAQVQVEISDNGQGMQDPQLHAGMGIIGMRERVHALGGTFLLTHVPGDGVRVEVLMPLDDKP